jgi:hypothetical protein
MCVLLLASIIDLISFGQMLVLGAKSLKDETTKG